MPRIVLAQNLLQELSPTVTIDTASPPAGHAFFVERDGIYEDFFSARGWFNPVFGGQHGNGTGNDPRLLWWDNAVWIPWTNNSVPRMNGFFNFTDVTTTKLLLGTPWIVPSNNPYLPWQFNWATMAPPDAAGFYVESGFAWNNGPTGRLNIFGTMTWPPVEDVGNSPSFRPANNGIRDLWWDGSQWNWSDHGRPPGNDTVALWRNSAVWDHTAQQGHVLVAAQNVSDSQSRPQAWDLFWDGSQWSWNQLGNPFGTSTASSDQVVTMVAPVVVDGVQNDGTYVLTAFVVGLHGTNMNSGHPQYRFELYAREKVGASAWSDWIQLGNPANAPFVDLGGCCSWFLVNQGARWMDGSLLRGSLFGTGLNAELIHLFHDDNGWQWDTPVPLPQPPAATIWIKSRVSCGVLTNVFGYPGWHLTALMRDNKGTIWNREYDSNTATWSWRILQ